MKELCIQFYTIGQEVDPFYKTVGCYLESGFHYVSEDIPKVWVDANSKLSSSDKMCIEEAEKIYVSVWSLQNLLRAMRWGDVYRGKKFVVGGPIPRFFMSPKEIMQFVRVPENVLFYDGLAESLLKGASKWNISMPQYEMQNHYSFTVGEICYWKGCSFCRYKERGDLREYNIKDLVGAPSGAVWINTPALTPKQVELLPLLSFDDKFYQGFIRGDSVIYPKLKEVLPKIPKPERIGFRIGVEFPSNRMLSRMCKGTTVNDLLRVVHLLDSYGITTMLLYIYNWLGLEEEDLVEAGEFLKEVGSGTNNNIMHTVSRLSLRSEIPLPLYPTASNLMKKYLMRYSYFPILSSKDRMIDKRWLSMIEEQPGFVAHRRFKAQKDLPAG